jgi:lysophospholipase L1-like esterase
MSRWKGRAAMVLMGMSFLLLLEIFFRVFFPSHTYEKSAILLEMTMKAPLFEISKMGGGTFFRQSENWFGPMHYTHRDHVRKYYELPKPDPVFRIVVMGGSSAAGYPFGPRIAFAKWLEIMLQAGNPARRFEVINCGINSLASKGIRHFIPQVLEIEPDMVIIYAGHNDSSPFKRYNKDKKLPQTFLALHYKMLYLQTYRVLFDKLHFRLRESDIEEEMHYGRVRLAGARPENEIPFFSKDKRQLVRSTFSENIDAIIAAYRTAGIPLIFCTVQGNLRDFAPEGSAHGVSLLTEDLDKFNRLYESGVSAMAGGDYKISHEKFKTAAKIDDSYAILRFRTGQALLGLGQEKEARNEFMVALDLDDHPSRAQSWINSLIREKANGQGVYLVDIEAALSKSTSNGIPGDDLILDDVHPRIKTHRMIAEAIIKAAIEKNLVPLGETALEPAGTAANDYQILLSPAFIARHLMTLSRVQEQLGRIKKALVLNHEAINYIPYDQAIRKNLERLSEQYQGLDTNE